MTIIKEIDFMETSAPLYTAKLENGVTLFVYEKYAKGDDGNTYYHIGRKDKDGDLLTLGWSCEVDEELIIE